MKVITELEYTRKGNMIAAIHEVNDEGAITRSKVKVGFGFTENTNPILKDDNSNEIAGSGRFDKATDIALAIAAIESAGLELFRHPTKIS